jgi:hypothetical protein
MTLRSLINLKLIRFQSNPNLQLFCFWTLSIVLFLFKTQRFGDWIVSVFRWNLPSWAKTAKLVPISGHVYQHQITQNTEGNTFTEWILCLILTKYNTNEENFVFSLRHKIVLTLSQLNLTLWRKQESSPPYALFHWTSSSELGIYLCSVTYIWSFNWMKERVFSALAAFAEFYRHILKLWRICLVTNAKVAWLTNFWHRKTVQQPSYTTIGIMHYYRQYNMSRVLRLIVRGYWIYINRYNAHSAYWFWWVLNCVEHKHTMVWFPVWKKTWY